MSAGGELHAQRSALLDRFRLDLDGDLLADEDPARLERLVPGEAEGLPVELQGVVTWRSARRNHAIIVHDGERSIWVTFLWMSSQWEKGLAPEPQVV